MIYVLVYRRFDYHRFDDVITASTDLESLKETEHDLPLFMEYSAEYREIREKLHFDEVPHFVIMEFKE